MLEFDLHSQVVSYLKDTYPQVRFKTALDGIHMSKVQAVMARRFQWGGGYPDLLVHRVYGEGKYCGLALELKVKSPYKKNGELFSKEHLYRQEEWLRYLEACGYYARFSWGFDMTKSIIDAYVLGNELKY